MLPGLAGFLGRELVRAIGISQDGSAVVDGGDFAMERWVAVVGDGVGADADELSGAAGGVVDDGGAEGTEWAGRG